MIGFLQCELGEPTFGRLTEEGPIERIESEGNHVVGVEIELPTKPTGREGLAYFLEQIVTALRAI